MPLPKHVLVIRLSAMGDVAMTVPVLLALSKKYPDVKITFLTRKFFTPFFHDIPNIEVYEAEVKGRHKGFFGLKKLSSELAALEIDAVADLHNVLRSKILTIFFQMKGMPVKQIHKGRKEKRALTRPTHKLFMPLKSTHERYAEVFSELGFTLDVQASDFLPKKQLSAKILEVTGAKETRWLGIAPFAQHPSKAYPEDLLEEVLLRLQNEQNLKIFLFGGGKQEQQKLEQWEKEFPNSTSVAGKLTFEEELRLISNLDLMLSMDSGNGHLAANYRVPVVTLWGLTHPYTGFAPFGQPSENWLLPDLEKYSAIPTSVYGKEIPRGYEEVMRSIPPEKVVLKIKEKLN